MDKDILGFDYEKSEEQIVNDLEEAIENFKGTTDSIVYIYFLIGIRAGKLSEEYNEFDIYSDVFYWLNALYERWLDGK